MEYNQGMGNCIFKPLKSAFDKTVFMDSCISTLIFPQRTKAPCIDFSKGTIGNMCVVKQRYSCCRPFEKAGSTELS